MNNELAISQMIAKAKELADSLSPYERADLAGQVKYALDVPGTIWSPEDYESYAENMLMLIPTATGTPNIPSKEDISLLAVQAFERHAEAGTDLTDDDWDVINQTVENSFEERFHTKEAKDLAPGEMIFFTDYDRGIFRELSIIETVEVDDTEKIVYLDLKNGKETYAVEHPVDYLPKD